MNNQCLTDFDHDLINIANRKWLPWIGQDYSKTQILLIGESFYEDGDGWLENPFAIRNFVTNQGLNSDKDGFKKRLFFHNIEKTLLNKAKTDYQERTDLWTSVAFVNLVQKILESRKIRPSHKDYDEGWNVILDMIEIIKPKLCIRLGIHGIGRLGCKLANEKKWQYQENDFYKKPYIINLKKDNFDTKLIFTNHPSGSLAYNYSYWYGIISQNDPEERIKQLDKSTVSNF